MRFVTFHGNELSMQDSAMEELGLSSGQNVSEDQMWECIAANARAFCREMDMRRSRGEDAPDTERLAAMCGHERIEKGE